MHTATLGECVATASPLHWAARPVAELADDVRGLLLSLGSVEPVEVLLLLARTPERTFTQQGLAQQLHLGRSVELTLDRLASLNLVDVRVGNTLLYRYSPTTPVLAATVSRLARDYDQRRLLVLEVLMAIRPDSAIAAFADAFRLKRRKTDG